MRYKVEFSYRHNGKIVTSWDETWAETRAEALEEIMRWYADLPEIRAVRMWRDPWGTRWEEIELPE